MATKTVKQPRQATDQMTDSQVIDGTIYRMMQSPYLEPIPGTDKKGYRLYAAKVKVSGQ